MMRIRQAVPGLLTVVWLLVLSGCGSGPVTLTEEERQQAIKAVEEEEAAVSGSRFAEDGTLKTVPPPSGLTGKITDVRDGLAVVTLDIGYADGVRLGHRFEVRSAKDDRRIAYAVVRWDRDPRTALANIEPAIAADNVKVGDRVVPPEPGAQAGAEAEKPDERRRELVTGKVVGVKRPRINIEIFSGFPPEPGDMLNVHRAGKGIGRVRVVEKDGRQWAAEIVYEAEDVRVAEGDRISGFTYPDKK